MSLHNWKYRHLKNKSCSQLKKKSSEEQNTILFCLKEAKIYCKRLDSNSSSPDDEDNEDYLKGSIRIVSKKKIGGGRCQFEILYGDGTTQLVMGSKLGKSRCTTNQRSEERRV